MAESKAKRYSKLAGIFFALALSCRIISLVKAHDTPSRMDILYLIILALFAVSTFLRNKKIALIAAAMYAFDTLYYVISYFNVYNILAFLASISLAAVIMLAMENSRTVRSIWYISGVLELIICFVIFSWVVPLDWLFETYMWGEIGRYIISFFNDYGDMIAIMFSFFCVGLWCKYEVECAAEKSPAAVAASSGQVRNAAPAIGDADKLKTYKSLLDSGAITQEEFEEKKRQVLGL